MTNTLKYKGYTGTVEIDLNDDILFGHVLFIDDFISFEGQTIRELQESFKNTIDEYLEDCKALGLKPNKPLSGQFSIRTTPDNHKKLAEEAADADLSINDLMNKIIEDHICNGFNGRGKQTPTVKDIEDTNTSQVVFNTLNYGRPGGTTWLQN